MPNERISTFCKVGMDGAKGMTFRACNARHAPKRPTTDSSTAAEMRPKRSVARVSTAIEPPIVAR